MSRVTTSQRFPVTVERTARYSDLDPTRRLGRDALLRWFEDARVAVERDAFDSDLTTREHWQVKRLLAGVRVDVLAPLKVTGRPYEVGLGVTRIEASGQLFDPQLHEAVTTVPTSSPEQDGVVVGIVRHGYRVGADVLRPVTVAVAKAES